MSQQERLSAAPQQPFSHVIEVEFVTVQITISGYWIRCILYKNTVHVVGRVLTSFFRACRQLAQIVYGTDIYTNTVKTLTFANTSSLSMFLVSHYMKSFITVTLGS